MAAQTMLAPGPLARSVADLALCLSVLAGRDRRDPRSVDVPLVGARLAPEDRRVALVMSLPGSRVAPDALAAVARAGAILASLGWNVDEATPPEVPRVCELWHKLVATDLAVVMPLMEPVVSPALFDHVMRLCRAAKVDEVSNNRLHEERSRLMRAWSGFFAEYPVVIGPNLTCAPWAVGADLAADTGLSLLEDATRFILPANALGLPVVAVPMDGDGGQPTSLQIYADLWREDLCLEVAEILERHGARVMPIDPAGG